MKQKNKKLREKNASKSAKKINNDNLQTIVQDNFIQIFDHLLEKHQKLDNLIVQLQKEYQEDIDNQTESLKITFLILLFKLCGLKDSISKINLQKINQSIQKLFQEIYKEPSILQNNRSLYLIDKKNKEYKVFSDNLSKFWGLLFSDKTDLICESKVLEHFYEWSQIFSNSKIRIIRNVMIEYLNILVPKALKFYKNLIEKNKNTKASKIKKFISKIYRGILKQRLKDVDLSIRQKLFSIINNIYKQISNQILTVQELSTIFTPFITDKNIDNRNLALNTLQKVYSSEHNNKRMLIQYGNLIVHKLIQFSGHQQRQILEVIQLLNTLKSYDKEINFNEHELIGLFEKVALNSSKTTLRELVCLFYKIQFENCNKDNLKSQLQKQDEKEIISCIIRKFEYIGQQKIKEIIFTAFISYHKNLFKCQELFILLIEQKIFQNKDIIKMNLFQIKTLLIFIRTYIKFIQNYQEDKKQKQQEYSSNIIQVYNRCLFVYSKQIFFNKASENLEIIVEYIKLYNLIQTPVSSNFQSYLSIITERLIIFFQKFSQPSIIKEIPGVLKKISSESKNILAEEINMKDLQKMVPSTIIKFSAIISNFYIQNLLENSKLNYFMQSFNELNDYKIQMQVLTILHHAHFWKFKQLFEIKNEIVYKVYVQFREQFMNFLYLTFREEHTHAKTKKAIFNLICDTLSIIMNNRLNDIQILYFEPKKEMIELLFTYIKINFNKKMEQQVNIDKMLQNLNLNKDMSNNEQNMIKNILKIYQSSIRFCIIPQCLNFISLLLQGEQVVDLVKQSMYSWVEAQNSKQNQNRFIFWKIFKQILPKDPQKIEIIVINLIQIYFMKKLSKQKQKNLQNKLILFIAQSIEQSISEKEFNIFLALQIIIKKCFRRYDKITLSKLYAHFNSKLTRFSQQDRKQKKLIHFKKTLQKYSKMNNQKKSSKKQKVIVQQSQQQSKQEQQQEVQKNPSLSSDSDSDLDIQPARQTRSMKKRKLQESARSKSKSNRKKK